MINIAGGSLKPRKPMALNTRAPPGKFVFFESKNRFVDISRDSFQSHRSPQRSKLDQMEETKDGNKLGIEKKVKFHQLSLVSILQFQLASLIRQSIFPIHRFSIPCHQLSEMKS